MDMYKTLLQSVLDNHAVAPSRAGPVLKQAHNMFSWDMATGFPALTSRRLAFKSMAGELACFVKGHTEIAEFHDRKCRVWDANLADWNAQHNQPTNTSLGPVYGSQWRNFGGVDQLTAVLNKLRVDPYDRRMIVSAWNPIDQPSMVLPPCHIMLQVSSVDGETVDLAFYMRSVDLALGFPFDIASYGLLLSLICHEVNMKPGKLTAFLSDCHIYQSNLLGVQEYLKRPTHIPPTLEILTPTGTSVVDFEPEQVRLANYTHEPAINMGQMAV